MFGRAAIMLRVEEGAVPTAAPLNPGGKPRNENEAAVQQAQQQAGSKLDGAMSEAAKAEAAARARAGGK